MRSCPSLCRALLALGLLGSVGTAGCVVAAPPTCRCLPPPQLLSEELHGVFEHRVEVVAADPSLALAVGTTTSPARIEWREADGWLDAVDVEDPTLVRAAYAIQGHVAVDPRPASGEGASCCPTGRFSPAVDGAPPNALQLDLSKELATGFGDELGLAELEPIARYGGGDEDGAGSPIVAFDALSGELSSIEVPAYYSVPGDPPVGLTVIHRFERVE